MRRMVLWCHVLGVEGGRGNESFHSVIHDGRLTVDRVKHHVVKAVPIASRQARGGVNPRAVRTPVVSSTRSFGPTARSCAPEEVSRRPATSRAARPTTAIGSPAASVTTRQPRGNDRCGIAVSEHDRALVVAGEFEADAVDDARVGDRLGRRAVLEAGRRHPAEPQLAVGAGKDAEVALDGVEEPQDRRRVLLGEARLAAPRIEALREPVRDRERR